MLLIHLCDDDHGVEDRDICAVVMSLGVIEKFGSILATARIGYIRSVTQKTLMKNSYVIFVLTDITLILLLD